MFTFGSIKKGFDLCGDGDDRSRSFHKRYNIFIFVSAYIDTVVSSFSHGWIYIHSQNYAYG